jgi:hypothetical protein
MQHNEDSGVLEAFAQYTQAFQVLDSRQARRSDQINGLVLRASVPDDAAARYASPFTRL